MPDPELLSEFAEGLLRQLATRAADHQALHSGSSAPPPPQGRYLRVDAPHHDTDALAQFVHITDTHGRHLQRDLQHRDANALVDFVAVAESFDTGRLLPLLPPSALREAEAWSRRPKAWKKYAGVDPSAFDRWQALMGFVEVRNALQHGLGRLTDRQVTKHRVQVLAQVKAAGVDLNGDLLTVTRSDAERCHLTCADYIRFIDRRLPNGSAFT